MGDLIKLFPKRFQETPEEPPCTVCGGRGEIVIDDLHVRKCNCVWRRALRQHLGAELWEAPAITTSPLYEHQRLADGTVKIITDLTTANLYIQASSWNGLLPHLRWTLGNKGTEFYFRIITDELIKRCFVGGMAYKSKRMVERESEESFNTLADMVGEVCDLVILKLGWLGYKNISAAGAVYEALLIRENLRLPTWLVSTDTHSWEGSHSHNSEVETYIDRRRFQHIKIASDIEDENPFETDGMSVVVEDTAEPPAEELSLVPPPVEDSQLDTPSKSKGKSWDNKPRPKNRGKWNKPGGGDGPLGDL